MTSRTERYLAMYSVLDGITDVEKNAAKCEAMQPVWDALSPDEKQQARAARQARHR